MSTRQLSPGCGLHGYNVGAIHGRATAVYQSVKRALGIVTAVVVGTTLLWTGPAHANFHLIKITEIFPGTAAEPAAQFVELQMYSDGQNQLATHSLVVYDDMGLEQARYTFTAAVPDGSDQAHVLLATPEAETLFGVEADLAMAASIQPGGGKVCWEPGLVDCASWGSYSAGATDQGASATGTPFNAPAGLVPGQSMERKISGGANADKLDAGDDTNDSAADFQLASPTPQANSASAPSTHDRAITLTLKGHLVAKGRVTVKDDFADCGKSIPVKVQRRAGKTWKTVKKTATDSRGAYSVSIPDDAGKYRAQAPAVTPTDADKCAAATSKPVES